jgi:DNA-binding YbaB/EbfC family protein
VTDQGGFDLNNLMEQAQAMQQQMQAAQEEQARQTITGSAAGGKVAVELTGGGEYRKVTIAPDVVDPDDVEMLEELVLAALRDAGRQLAELESASLGNLELPDIGGLGGLLGGS